jgi:hypothetical protein
MQCNLAKEIIYLLQIKQVGCTIEYDPEFIAYHDGSIPKRN